MSHQVEPIRRVCRDCGETFVISPEEREFFAALACQYPDQPWKLPNACTPCRSARRRARETVTASIGDDVTLRCVRCGADFVFRSRDREYYAAQGFRFPRRCPLCRQEDRASGESM